MSVELDALSHRFETAYRASRRVLSFAEYLELFASHPARYGRDAAQYVRDLFDHFGVTQVTRPWGEFRRFRLFDGVSRLTPARESAARSAAREPMLVGQEEVQEAVYRALCHFVEDGRPNRLVLLHGPNGSAKSTVAACILRALEHYSTLDEGALYRFHWVFPSRKALRGAIGFAERGAQSEQAGDSYAHLPDSAIESRIAVEVRDHPLFLLPEDERRALLERLYAGTGARPPEWLRSGRPCHKNHAVLNALLTAHGGSLAEALRHVQVERYFLSRGYRVGAVTIGPEMSVDARERQITADRSLAALPTALQATSLYEVQGELVDAAGGVLEWSDLLKRPIDAFRYLQLTLETGEFALSQQIVQTNCVMVGSANEVHLDAFRNHHEFPSFRGRLELVRAPYLRSYLDEARIYDELVVPHLSRPMAPHAVATAALFAVLTRLRAPDPKRLPSAIASHAASLTPLEKADLYARGVPPTRLDSDAQKLLRSHVASLWNECEAVVEYEGRLGVSPREMRAVLLDASQRRPGAHTTSGAVSPFAVLHELDELCKRTGEFDWLREKPQPNGYHDHALFRRWCRDRLLDAVEGDLQRASGLVEEAKTTELFDRYVASVGTWVRGERVRHPLTGQLEPPDERHLREVEALLGVTDHAAHRRGLIAMVAAWAIDHPNQRVVYEVVLGELHRKLQSAVFAERRKAVVGAVRELTAWLRDREAEGRAGEERALEAPESPALPSLRDEERARAAFMFERLRAAGYDAGAALEAATTWLTARASP
jgi:serine protein kinase